MTVSEWSCASAPFSATTNAVKRAVWMHVVWVSCGVSACVSRNCCLVQTQPSSNRAAAAASCDRDEEWQQCISISKPTHQSASAPSITTNSATKMSAEDDESKTTEGESTAAARRDAAKLADAANATIYLQAATKHNAPAYVTAWDTACESSSLVLRIRMRRSHCGGRSMR